MLTTYLCDYLSKFYAALDKTDLSKHFNYWTGFIPYLGDNTDSDKGLGNRVAVAT